MADGDREGASPPLGAALGGVQARVAGQLARVAAPVREQHADGAVERPNQGTAHHGGAQLAVLARLARPVPSPLPDAPASAALPDRRVHQTADRRPEEGLVAGGKAERRSGSSGVRRTSEPRLDPFFRTGYPVGLTRTATLAPEERSRSADGPCGYSSVGLMSYWLGRTKPCS